MEEPEGVLKHKLKVYAYRKTRRLLRIGRRKAGHDPRSLFEGALIFQREEDEPEEVDEEELRKQRLEKNKEWRKRREMERWESCGMKPPPDPEVLREKNREKARKIEKKLFKEFLCSCCGDELVTDVWECAEGHVTCGDCFDKDNIGRDIHDDDDDGAENNDESSDVITALKTISRKSSKTRKSSLDSLKRSLSNSSVATICSIDTIISLRESLADIAEGDEDAEIKSFQKYLVNEIDFFLNTLEVRGDAIDFYSDYNNPGKSIFYNPDLEGISLDGDTNEGRVQSNAYVDEKSERVKKYMERLNEQGSLMSLRETLVDVIETNDNEVDPSWAKFRLEEIDFFLNTLNIRKDAIGYYGDYHNGHQSIFDHLRHHEDNNTSSDEDNTEEDDDNDEGSTDNDEKITKCAVCNNYIVRRNKMVEKLAKIFFNS